MEQPMIVKLLDNFVTGLMAYTENLTDIRSSFVWDQIVRPTIDGPQEAECELCVRLRSEARLPHAEQRVVNVIAQVIEDEELTFTVRCLGIERLLPFSEVDLSHAYDTITLDLKHEFEAKVSN